MGRDRLHRAITVIKSSSSSGPVGCWSSCELNTNILSSCRLGRLCLSGLGVGGGHGDELSHHLPEGGSGKTRRRAGLRQAKETDGISINETHPWPHRAGGNIIP